MSGFAQQDARHASEHLRRSTFDERGNERPELVEKSAQLESLLRIERRH
jgi:hypothetical protein